MGLFDKFKDAQQQASAAMQQAGGVGTIAGMTGTQMGGQAAYAAKANKIGQQGVEAPGVLHGIRSTGEKDFSGSEKIEFDVTVTPAGGAPYEATIDQYMLPAQLEGIQDGAAVTVKYDPDDPSQALLYGW